MFLRKDTRAIFVKDVQIGHQNKVVLQSMCTTKTSDVQATLAQIIRLKNMGCELVRVSVLDNADIANLPKLTAASPLPIIADIHYSFLFALKVMDCGISKIRINPGNITNEEELKAIIEKAKEKKIAIRIGINSGSIPLDLIDKYHGACCEAMLEACDRAVHLFEKYDFFDLVISLKATDPTWTIRLYEEAAKRYSYPLHLGVTEAGTLINGALKSAIGLAPLLLQGIGDTMRISLTEDPVEEIKVAKKLLLFTKVQTNQVEVIACPTCGRIQINLFEIVKEIEEYVKDLQFPLKIAILGCIVNGIGEGKEADIGVAGGAGKGIIFRKGKIYKTCKENELVDELKKLVDLEKERYESSHALKTH